MKTFITTSILVLVTQIAMSQFNYNGLYKSDLKDSKTTYFKIYNDGLVIMVTTSDDLTSVKNYFNRESNDVVVAKSQSNIKEGIRASFTLDMEGQKYNCIAVANNDIVTLTIMGPRALKTIQELRLVK